MLGVLTQVHAETFSETFGVQLIVTHFLARHAALILYDDTQSPVREKDDVLIYVDIKYVHC